MNFTRFISQRVIRGDRESRISRPIVRIATIGIAVGVALMILSLSIVKGFQKEVRNMVIGFGSHFHVVSNRDNSSKDSQRIEYSDSLYNSLKSISNVKHVQVFASKPGIIESAEGLRGVVIKGVSHDFDWSFLKGVLKSGDIIPADSLNANQIVLSSFIAKKLKVEVGSKVSLFFINDQSDVRQRNYTVQGIYETGLEDYDSQFVFVGISHVQKLSGWGLEAQLLIDTVSNNGWIAMGAIGFGGDGNYRYEWSVPGWEGEGPHFINALGDTSVFVVVKDLNDTKFDTSKAVIDFIEDSGPTGAGKFVVRTIDTGGSESNYIGGYEILINDYEALLASDDQIFNLLPFDLTVNKITERSPEIFSWLAMLDINVIIIIVLMIVISIVNMTSALLIIILERQQMIGTLKALGATDRPIMWIFMNNAAFIVGRGLLLGNILGLGIAISQYYFHFIPLDPVNYYVDTVPIELVWMDFLILDLGAIVVCLIALLIPAKYVSRISPIKSIRFN